MDWESFWNVLEYHLIERRLAPVVGRGAHYLQAGSVAIAGVLHGRWRPTPRPRKETPRMPDVESLPVVGRAILTKFDADARQAIVAAVRQEVAEEVQAQALEAAKAELEADYESRRIRLQDQVANAKAQADADAELRIEGAIARGLDAAKADLENTVLDLREERDQARQAQDAVTDVLLSIVRQVIPTRKTYLHSRGVLELDLYRLNIVLRPHGLRVRAEAVPDSERQVSTLITTNTSEARALFWTEAVKGAADEDEPLIDGIPAKYVVRP